MISVLPMNLNENQLTAIQNLEKELGKPLYAYSESDVKIATLSNTELEKVKELDTLLTARLNADGAKLPKANPDFASIRKGKGK